MQKLYLSLALLMSLVLGTGFAISGNSVSAQSYQMNDKPSYDDKSSYSSDSYSKYPTKDKPHVCQKGPFEGFYVSSFEFCKFAFDDRKDRNHDDNNNNNHDDNSLFNFYTVTATTPATEAGLEFEATASCNPGDQVTGGGFEITAAPGNTAPISEVGVTSSEPFPLDDDNSGMTQAVEGWEASFTINDRDIGQGDTLNLNLIAYAVCFETPQDDHNNNGPYYNRP